MVCHRCFTGTLKFPWFSVPIAERIFSRGGKDYPMPSQFMFGKGTWADNNPVVRDTGGVTTGRNS